MSNNLFIHASTSRATTMHGANEEKLLTWFNVFSLCGVSSLYVLLLFVGLWGAVRCCCCCCCCIIVFEFGFCTSFICGCACLYVRLVVFIFVSRYLLVCSFISLSLHHVPACFPEVWRCYGILERCSKVKFLRCHQSEESSRALLI